MFSLFTPQQSKRLCREGDVVKEDKTGIDVDTNMKIKIIYDVMIILALAGMIMCLGVEAVDKTEGYEGIERLRFGWWFYMQDGRTQTLEELENITFPFYNFNFSDMSPYVFHNETELQKYELNETQMKNRWRGIAKRLYSEQKV